MAIQKTADLIITSPAFENEGIIPARFTCDGQAINPPLEIKDLPHDTQTLALIVEDPDAPGGTFDHWIVWNMDPTKRIEENTLTGISGINSAGKTGYHPPCPPSGSHRYYFHVFALDTTLSLVAGEDRKALMERMDKHAIAKGTLMGRYQKINQPKAAKV